MASERTQAERTLDRGCEPRGHVQREASAPCAPGIRAPSSSTLDRDDEAEDVRRAHPPGVREGVATHEHGARAGRDDAVDVQDAGLGFTAREIARPHAGAQRGIDLDDVAVAHERQHAGAADADPERLSAAQHLGRHRDGGAAQSERVDGTSTKLFRASGRPKPCT